VKRKKPFPFSFTFIPQRLRSAGIVILFLCAMTQVMGCGAPSQMTKPEEAPADDRKAIEEQWGIKILPVHLTALDSLVDVRFKIIDAEKARPLTDLGAKPYLIDEATGGKCDVPEYEKTGTLRAKGKPKAGSNYFILFNNATGMKSGSKVTVVIGDFKIEHLVVE